MARRAGTLRGKHGASDRLSNLDGADSAVADGLLRKEPMGSNDSDFQDLDVLTVDELLPVSFRRTRCPAERSPHLAPMQATVPSPLVGAP